MRRRVTPRRIQPRRGVLLLIVLSLLVLFLLIGVTFIVTTGQFRRAAGHAVRQERSGDAPQLLTQMAMHQIVRGTTDRNSRMYGHSLLDDMYGGDGIRIFGVGHTAVPNSNGELVSFAFNEPQIVGPIPMNIDTTTPNFGRPGFYNGCVITVTSGPHAGKSSRVIRYEYPQKRLIVEAFPGVPDATTLSSEWFIINGPPFNGVGAGYNRTTGQMDRTLPSPTGTGMDSVAFRPNYSAYAPHFDGGQDESYDIADYQNMFLAHVPAELNPLDNSHFFVIPSFHRPALVNYFANRSTEPIDVNAYPDFWRTVILRPMAFDHPDFTGSNPTFDPINGPWDVDNDADGVAESVWIDLGMPVRMSEDGRLYKPLFAFLCRDMDGSLNVNAHGALAQLHADTNFYADSPVFPIPDDVAGGIGGTQIYATRGEGYGPAEIVLGFAMLQNPGVLQFNPMDWSNLLVGTSVQPGRYFGAESANAQPGRDATVPAGQDYDLLNAVSSPWLASPWLTTALNDSSLGRACYSRPPDLHGVGAVALDHAGQALYAEFNETPHDWLRNNPYETNLVTPNAWDTSFQAAELEPLLRYYDLDRDSLPSRLMEFQSFHYTAQPPPSIEFANAAINRNLITTHSFEVPVPAVPLDPVFIFQGAIDADPSSINKMVSPELLRNQKMNLNRMFGDGRDNNGNLVVDEPEELSADDNHVMDWRNDDPIAAPIAPLRNAYARHLYCTMMMLVRERLEAGQLDINYDGVLENPSQLGIVAKTIAQWAVNVADFRDPDSIMTPFQYDPNPYDGWSTDPAQLLVVWGCERPELLITETLATHDRRSEDLDNEDVMDPIVAATTSDPDDPDQDFDQRLRPMGSLFIELFNPWVGTYSRFATPNSSELPAAELYGPKTKDNILASVGVSLNAKSNNDPAGSPVWRILIVEDTSKFADPDDPTVKYDIQSQPVTNPLTPGFTFEPQHVERVVYFVDSVDPRLLQNDPDPNLGADYPPTPNRLVFVQAPVNANNTEVVQPGSYAVIGPGSANSTAFAPRQEAGKIVEYITPFGRALDGNGDAYGDGAGLNQGRFISFRPASNPNANQLIVADPVVAPQPLPRPVTAVVVDHALAGAVPRPRRLSVSEPVDDYASKDISNRWSDTLANGEGAYENDGKIYDEPFDVGRNDLIEPNPIDGKRNHLCPSRHFPSAAGRPDEIMASDTQSVPYCRSVVCRSECLQWCRG